jgi:hypothetical protein
MAGPITATTNKNMTIRDGWHTDHSPQRRWAEDGTLRARDCDAREWNFSGFSNLAATRVFGQGNIRRLIKLHKMQKMR